MISVGLVGAGLMGHGIALNVLKCGFPLAVLEHPGNQPINDLVRLGATTYGSALILASAVDVVIICVTGSPEVEAALTGPLGVLAGLRASGVVIDCSTSLPTSTERLAELVAAAGGRFLDAPMTRTPTEAAQGRLNLLVGGDAALLEECSPVLACFAESIVHAGPVGAGHRMKLLHNFVSLGFVTLLAEAAACAERTGIDMDVFIDVLAHGGGSGLALDRLSPYLTDRDPGGLRFSIANAAKDIGYYSKMAADAGVPHVIADGVNQTLGLAAAALGASALVPELVSFLIEAQR